MREMRMREANVPDGHASETIRVPAGGSDMQCAMECAHAALVDGQATVLNIVGEPPAATRHLLDTLLQRLQGDEFIHPRVVKSTPPTSNGPQPFEQLLFGAKLGDDEAVLSRRNARSALQLAAAELGVEEVPFLLARVLRRAGTRTPLLDAADDGSVLDGLAEALLTALWERDSRVDPLILVIEDLHLCSPATIELVHTISASLSGHVLLIVTAPIDLLGTEQDRVATILLGRAPFSLELVGEEPAPLASAHAELGRLCCVRGDLMLARQHLDCSLSIYRELRDDQGVGAVYEELARLERICGNYTLAQEHITNAFNVAAHQDDRRAQARALIVIAMISMDEGQTARALSVLELALTMCQEEKDSFGAIECTHVLGRLAQTQTEHVRALELLLDTLDEVGKHPSYPYAASLWVDIAESCQHLGDVPEAFEALSEAEQALGGEPSPLILCDVRRIEAKVELSRHNLSQARRAARRAVVLSRQTHCPARLSAALRTLGEVLAAEPVQADDAVQRCFMEAVAVGQEAGNRPEIAKSYRSFSHYVLSEEQFARNRQIVAEATKVWVLSEDLFSDQRLALDSERWFRLRLFALSACQAADEVQSD